MDKPKKLKARKKTALTAVVTIRMTEGERVRFRETNRLVGKTDSEVARKMLVGSRSREDRKCFTNENAWDYNRAMLMRGSLEKVWRNIYAVAETSDTGERALAVNRLLETFTSEFERIDDELKTLQLRGFYETPAASSVMDTEDGWSFNDH